MCDAASVLGVSNASTAAAPPQMSAAEVQAIYRAAIGPLVAQVENLQYTMVDTASGAKVCRRDIEALS